MLLSIILSLGVLVVLSQRFAQTCSRDAFLPGYYWDGQQCLKCKEPQCLCNIYHGCDDCIDNYFLDPNGNGCLRCPYGCSKCCELNKITSVICTLCLPKYQIINGVCVLEKGCIRFSEHGHCIDCTNFGGYYKSQNQMCLECPDGCGDCLSDSYCRSCKLGYFLDIFYNNSFTDQAASKILCKQCNSSTSTNLGPGCSKCIHIFEEDYINCTECFYGYYYDYTTANCTICPENCKTCEKPVPDQKTICTVCLNDKILSEDKTECQSCSGQIPQCLSCRKDTDFNYVYPFACEQCNNSYYLSPEFICKPCITNQTRGVRRCDDQIKLTQCEPGYLLIQIEDKINLKNLTYQCLKNKNQCRHAFPNGSCIDCETESGYLLQLKQQIEDQQLIECVGCQNYIKNCQDCVSNQQFNVSCLVCKPQYILSNGGCDACPDNCSDCANKDKCTICQTSFYIDENQKCSPCGIDKCDICNKTSNIIECKSCVEKWGLDLQNSCWECQIGCLLCNYHRNICSICDDYYYLYMGSCIRYPSNCLKANSLGFCYLCNTTINASQKGTPDWDESWNVDEYNFEINYDEPEDENAQPVTPPPPAPVPEQVAPEKLSIFYMSVNSYCLICSDYITGSITCPNQCTDDTFIIGSPILEFSAITATMIIMIISL